MPMWLIYGSTCGSFPLRRWGSALTHSLFTALMLKALSPLSHTVALRRLLVQATSLHFAWSMDIMSPLLIFRLLISPPFPQKMIPKVHWILKQLNRTANCYFDNGIIICNVNSLTIRINRGFFQFRTLNYFYVFLFFGCAVCVLFFNYEVLVKYAWVGVDPVCHSIDNTVLT